MVVSNAITTHIVPSQPETLQSLHRGGWGQPGFPGGSCSIIFAFTVLLLAAKLEPGAVLAVGRVSWQ